MSEDRFKHPRTNLGMGIGMLLGENFNLGKNSDMLEIHIDKIKINPNQPRKRFDESKLRELSSSIEKYGLLQPIVLISKDDYYIIVAGERRFRASKMANFPTIKAIILDLKEEEMLKMAMIENIQREDLNPVDEASGYQKIIETFDYTHEKLASEIGKSRSHITNLLRILNLPEQALDAIKNNQITLGHAKLLLSGENPEELLSEIIENNLSIKQLQNKINDQENPEEDNTSNSTYELMRKLYNPILSQHNNEGRYNIESKSEKPLKTSSELQQIEKYLKEHLEDIDIHLKSNGKEKIQIIINCEDYEDLTRIIGKCFLNKD